MILGRHGERHCVHGEGPQEDAQTQLLCSSRWLKLKSSFPTIIGGSFDVSAFWVTRWESAFGVRARSRLSFASASVASNNTAGSPASEKDLRR